MDIIIKDILALTGKKAQKTNICISGDRIISVGEVKKGFSAQKVIDGEGLFAIPSLINCHTHSYMTIFRNIADDLPFSEWLFDKIMPLEDIIDSHDAYWGCLLACMEMIKSGTSTFCDMHMFPGQSAEAAIKTGMRAVISRGLSGGQNDRDGGERRIKEALDEIGQYKENPLLSFMIAPHAVYTCDKEYLLQVKCLAEKFNLPVNIHISESVFEVENCINQTGMSPVKYLDSLGIFDIKTLAAHCVHLSDEDIDILARKNVSVAANPKSNLKLGNGIAPVKKMFEKGANICIGTDGAASNNSLNMFSEMNYTALLHKGVSGDASVITASDVLAFATENAAKALGINDIGKIEEGYKADIAILDLNRPHMRPLNNPVSSLCYSATGAEVVTSIINGEIVMENGVLTKIDEEEVYKNIEKIKEKFKKKG